MPKATNLRKKSAKSHSHAPAVQLSSAPATTFEAGALAGPSGMNFASFVGQSSTEALKSLAAGPSSATAASADGVSSAGDPYSAHISKKDKRTMKREALLSRLNPEASSSTSPYTLSSSAARRAKRKAKTELTGGSLSALSAALAAAPATPAAAAADDDEDEWYGENGYEGTSRRARKEKNRKAAAGQGTEESKIGEGKGKPLSAKERSKAVKAEAARTPQILAHPAFRANPWATIRQHAGNSLVMKAPEPPKERKKTTAGGAAQASGVGNRSWGGRAEDDMEMDM